jgi:hypothetical protein
MERFPSLCILEKNIYIQPTGKPTIYTTMIWTLGHELFTIAGHIFVIATLHHFHIKW